MNKVTVLDGKDSEKVGVGSLWQIGNDTIYILALVSLGEGRIEVALVNLHTGGYRRKITVETDRDLTETELSGLFKDSSDVARVYSLQIETERE